MEPSRAGLSAETKISSVSSSKQSYGKVAVGPILNAGKLKALLLADGSSTRKCRTLDLSHGGIRKIALSLGEVAALDFEGLTELDLHGNLLVTLDGHSLAFPHLQNLRASKCRIRSLENFGSHFRIRQLDLSDNQLTQLMGLADTPLRFTLQALNIANNHLRDFKGLAPLSTFESLEVLDIRGNPVADFGHVAEGFVLLCCHTLRQLNGRTVSEDVRSAVDSWAVDDGCGRATAATVAAFKEALLHPEGPALLATRAQPSRSVRPLRPSSDEHGGGSACEARKPSATSTELRTRVEASEQVYQEDQALWDDGQAVCLIHCNAVGDEDDAFDKRICAADAQPAAEEPTRAQSAASGSLAREVIIADASRGLKQNSVNETAVPCSACSIGRSQTKRQTGCSLRDASLCSHGALTRLEREVLVHSAGIHTNVGACGTCKSCSCMPLPHLHYYHSNVPHISMSGICASKESPHRRRGCAVKACSCTGTQTPGAWMHPLDLSLSSHCASCSSANEEVWEQPSKYTSTLPVAPVDCDAPVDDSALGKKQSVSRETMRSDPQRGDPCLVTSEEIDSQSYANMKGLCRVFWGAFGLALSVYGTRATFVPRRQLRYATRSSDAVGQNVASFYSQGPSSFPRQHGVLSADFVEKGELMSHQASEGEPSLAADGSSLLQLQSEAEEEEASEAEDAGAEVQGEDKAAASETAEARSEGEKHDDATAKEHSGESQDESQSASSSKAKAESQTGTEEAKAHTKDEAAGTNHTGSERKGKHEEEKKLEADQEGKGKETPAHSAQAEGAESNRFDAVLTRLKLLLKASAGKKLLDRLLTMIDLHEKEEEAEKALKREAETAAAAEGKPKHVETPDKDLLLSQQLSNMWVLPLHEEEKRNTCLSGFEKLTHEATLTCSDPQCFKLETDAKQCPYMSIVSIMRKEDLELLQHPSGSAAKTEVATQKDHMLLGFDGECKTPEILGAEILSILQRPKHLAKKHAFERTTGGASTVPLQKHHLDLVCDPDDKTEYPSCKTVYEALNHFSAPQPRALPEMLVLTDIGDLKDTLGLYRINFIFEGLVPFATPDGTKIDALKHKLSAADADFIQKHRHQDITATVMLKEN
ncbi:hypothetical protein Efla_004855 [Eimeria flavescens]